MEKQTRNLREVRENGRSENIRQVEQNFLQITTHLYCLQLKAHHIKYC